MVVSLQAFKAQAAGLGFNLAGVIPARPAPHLQAYLRWVMAGMQGEMDYLARPDRLARRQDLNVILPGVKSLAILALDYHTRSLPAEIASDPARGRIAAYAWGRDYHALMTPRLGELAEWISVESRAPALHRVYVDTGAVLERDHAQQAGLGFIGKNTLLIHPRRGSWFFLGEVLTTAEFDAYDLPGPGPQCGRCERCLAACPTRAFPAPYQLDARRCISYLTIEHDGPIPEELRPLIGNRIYGCDDCQLVCPWNKFAQPSVLADFDAREGFAGEPIVALLAWDEASFLRRTEGSAIRRIGHVRWLRNLAVAAGNVARLAPGRVALTQGDLLCAVAPGLDLIVANLPYVTRQEWTELPDGVKSYEPALALDGGLDGLDDIRALLPQAATRLRPGGLVLLEIGWQQGAAAAALARTCFPAARVAVRPDFAGLDRFVAIQT